MRGAGQLFPWAALAFLAASLRVSRPSFLLAGVLLANAWAWSVTNWPLQSLYGLLTSNDRVGNLALVQVVAAGNSPLHTLQANQLHFEPFWGLLVAALSGFDPERVLGIYPFLPLVAVLAFALAAAVGLRREPTGEAEADAAAPWEAVVVAAFATLLSSAAFEYAGTYRVPWAMTFLLKPNHALGLVLFPLLLKAFARVEGWRGRLAVGFLLHVQAWLFVIHMAFVAAGLLVFAFASWLARRADRRRDAWDAGTVIGVNVLVVSPYLVMLLVGYPFLDASPRAMVPPFSAHLLEGTLKQGVLFWLGAWGLVVATRRGDRLSRALVAQVTAAYLIWAAMLGLSLLQLARERDEVYYWLRFLTAAAAGIGAFDLAGRAAARIPALGAPGRRAAALLAVALPFALPYWWNPLVMDSYAPGSLAPLPDRLRLPTDFIRRSTDPRAIFAGDREYARYVAALGARRVTLAETFHQPKDAIDRVRLEEALLFDATGGTAAERARGLGVSYFVVTPGLLGFYRELAERRPPEDPRRRVPRRAEIEARPHLLRVFAWEDGQGDFVDIYRLEGASR